MKLSLSFSRGWITIKKYTSLKKTVKMSRSKIIFKIFWRLLVLGIFLDLETSGLNPFKHRTFEIAFRIIDLFTGIERAAYERIVYQPLDVWLESDPNSLKITGFSIDMLRSGIPEKMISDEIIDLFISHNIVKGEAVFVCQNPSFDRPFFTQIIPIETQEKLRWPYHWLDFASMTWALSIKEMVQEDLLTSKINLSKDDIARTHGLPPEESPHRAMQGVNHLLLCYRTVVGYPATKSLISASR